MTYRELNMIKILCKLGLHKWRAYTYGVGSTEFHPHTTTVKTARCTRCLKIIKAEKPYRWKYD